MSSIIPRPALDRAALERVLARASELQSRGDTGEVGSVLSDEQILELGREVGLSPEAIRQAIAEERGRIEVPDERGIAGTWLGVATVSAARIVPGSVNSVLDAIDSSMRGELSFDISRRFPDRMQWVPKRGFLEVMKTQLGRNAQAADLRYAESVSATVVTVDAQRVHVRIDAIMAETRRQSLHTGAVVALGSGFAAFMVGVTGAGILFAIPVFGLGTGVGNLIVRDRYRQTVHRVTNAVEQLLDRLEFGPAKRKGGLVDKLLG